MIDEPKTPHKTHRTTTHKSEAEQKNEGEGNRTAARAYNKAAHHTAKSGDVEKKAHAAKEAREGAERAELEAAEGVGKQHSHGEDPQIAHGSKDKP